jgi:hypothetical protein
MKEDKIKYSGAVYIKKIYERRWLSANKESMKPLKEENWNEWQLRYGMKPHASPYELAFP